jgi:hypothetical protein
MGLLLDLLPQEEREHILKLLADAGGNGSGPYIIDDLDDEAVALLLLVALETA